MSLAKTQRTQRLFNKFLNLCVLAPLREIYRYQNLHARTFPGYGVHAQAAAQLLGALAHELQAEMTLASRLGGVKASAIVLDADADPAVILLKRQVHAARLGVLAGVGKSLLDDA